MSYIRVCNTYMYVRSIVVSIMLHTIVKIKDAQFFVVVHVLVVSWHFLIHCQSSAFEAYGVASVYMQV